MLDADTKRRIDTARDILVGKVPDPKSQVEQITIALIYKFMDDIDAESEEWGGDPEFFAGDFSRYGWTKLMRPGMGGHEMLNLYAEAITRMPENPGIPPLFRDIFNNAYLPYRDPETLRAFLKIIDEFSYDHSERLGDAFEYLLSVLGSQGDAGQFRTPRHIIDFMVAVLDPKKDEAVLDPACGTAGFLIKSYKHIVASNTGADGHSALTPDERGRLADNFRGYDISPDMVRLSLVNMYLHGFAAPHIFEYDTLTSEDRWNEYADVILANPPFMSPKGGIRPHNRFSVKATRSEVLFVDYMAEHLTTNGRAGIIVPEGIIFQSQNAYKQLRKMLVENYLVAVVSLPAGVFNPYSGVKTSVLIMDRALAKRTDTIAFFKVENDGFDLGAQRRSIARSDLPQVQIELAEYMGRLRAGATTDDFQPTLGVAVEKERIAADEGYNLSGERYRQGGIQQHDYPLVSFGESDLFRVEGGGTPKSDVREYWNGPIPWITLVDLPPTDMVSEIKNTQRTITEVGLAKSSARLIPENSVVVSTRATIGRIGINRVPLATNQGFKNIVIQDQSRAISEYVALAVTKLVPMMKAWASGGTFKEISKSKFCQLAIPLPPLEVQQAIVAEIEGYQKVIDGARAVVDNYRPHIVFDPDWPVVGITDLVADEPYSFKAGPFGSTLKKECYVPVGFKVYGQEQVIRGDATFGDYYIDKEKYNELESCKVKAGDVLVSLVGTYGRTLIVPSDHEPGIINPRLVKITLNQQKMIPEFLVNAFTQEMVLQQIHAISHGGTMNILSIRALKRLRLPLPSLETQRAIVAEIEREQAIMASNRELIQRFEGKIQRAVARVWESETSTSLQAGQR